MESLCVILDVGVHMYKESDCDITNNVGYSSVESIVQTKLFSESKDELALIFCGTKESNNSLNDSDSEIFKHISVISELDRNTVRLLKNLHKDVTTQHISDLLEAIYVAADHMIKKLRGRKNESGRKRILVISNLRTEIDLSQIDLLITSLKEESISVSVISDRKITNETTVKSINEEAMLKISDETSGNCFSFNEIHSLLDGFDSKTTVQRGWKVDLEISNICSLSLVGYTKIKPVKPPSLKPLFRGDVRAEIDKRTEYRLNDPEKTVALPNDIIRGVRYGRSIVPLNEEDIKSMKFETEKSMKLIGFTEKVNVPQTLLIGEGSMFFVVDKENHSAAVTALIYAMYGCNVVGLVRRVYNRVSAPRLGVLIPRIKSDHVCFVYSDIAFSEDIRLLKFPGFFESDGVSAKKAMTFTEKELSVIDDFIDRMMLVEKSPDGTEKEMFKPSNIRNPVVQNFYRCMQFRLMHPNEKLPDLSNDILSRIVPSTRTEDIKIVIDLIKENFPFKTKLIKPKKNIGQKSSCSEETICKRLKLDITDNSSDLSNLMKSKVSTVGSLNPVGDFLVLIKCGNVASAISEMKNHIWHLINSSYMNDLYEKALSCLIELRKQSIELSNPDQNLVATFNTYLENMKDLMNTSKTKKEFWKLVVQEKISLISKLESEFGCPISQSDSFLLEDFDLKTVKKSDDDFDILFDDM